MTGERIFFAFWSGFNASLVFSSATANHYGWTALFALGCILFLFISVGLETETQNDRT